MFGSEPLCNHNPSHGFLIGGFCFPLCTRCTAIAVFTILGLIVFLKNKKNNLPFLIIVYIIGTMCIFDALLQAFTNYESRNNVRFFTGAFLGLMIVHLTFKLADYLLRIFNKVLKKQT